MLNNQTSKLKYIEQLEKENIMLKEENKRLKNRILFGYQQSNTTLLQKELMIRALKKELAKARQENVMLVSIR